MDVAAGPPAWGVAVGLALPAESDAESNGESVVDSDEHAAATKRIKDSSAKIGFILDLVERARHLGKPRLAGSF